MADTLFPDRDRIDARGKVTGATEFVADLKFPNLLYAMTVPSRIAKGRITSVSTEAALKVPGVVKVLTPPDFPPPVQPTGPMTGPAAIPPPPLIVPMIAYRGQPVALVLAETLEAAIEGAELVEASYAAEDFVPLPTSPGARTEPAEGVKFGDAPKALAAAATVIEAEYIAPAQHHNPMEMLSTTAVWADGRLTIYESTQSSGVVKAKVAQALRLDPAIVDCKSTVLGGAFGQKGAIQRQTAIVAFAAIQTGRPVKLLMPRGQVFHNASFRPISRHRIKIGASAEGKMVAVQYDVDHQQSQRGQFAPQYHDVPTQLYDIPNFLGTAANVRIDTQAPSFMRCPHPHPACFAFESAVDELAYKLGRDPVALRLDHRATVDHTTGKPLSSCHLSECLESGARRFGWDRRTPAPGSMTLPDGTLVGWGVGCGGYPSRTGATIATLRIAADGSTRLAISGHEMGQGIRTMAAAVLMRHLDVDPTKLEIVMGDTTAVPQHVTAGSWGTASAAPVVEKAALQMKAAVAELLAGRTIPGTLHQQIAAVRRPFLQIEVSYLAPGQDENALKGLRFAGFAVAGPAYPEFSSFSYAAHFVEVHIEPRTRRIRVPRVVSTIDCGRVLAPRTAVSQVHGAVVWGISSALREETEVDPRYGGWLNNDFADYVVPVNADIGDIDVGFVNQPDPLLNSEGVKGLGEVAMAGVSAGVANAIFHATGRRLRKMPIRVDDLI